MDLSITGAAVAVVVVGVVGVVVTGVAGSLAVGAVVVDAPPLEPPPHAVIRAARTNEMPRGVRRRGLDERKVQ